MQLILTQEDINHLTENGQREIIEELNSTLKRHYGYKSAVFYPMDLLNSKKKFVWNIDTEIHNTKPKCLWDIDEMVGGKKNE